jgi:hypothetical protein
LIERCRSNANAFTQDGAPIVWAQPLSIGVGETQTFYATLVNASDKPVTTALRWRGAGVVLGDAPDTATLPARGRMTIPVTVRGAQTGAGSVAVNDTALELRVVGATIAAAELHRVRSVGMIFDSWYSPGAVGATIELNDVPVGKLPGNGGYSSWTVRQPLALAGEAAAAALGPVNRLTVETTGRRFKMRNVILELTLDDGTVVHLPAEQSRPQSSPPDWPAAEGVRLRAGEPMVWTF